MLKNDFSNKKQYLIYSGDDNKDNSGDDQNNIRGQQGDQGKYQFTFFTGL